MSLKYIAVTDSSDKIIAIAQATSEPAARNGIAKKLLKVRDASPEELKEALDAGNVLVIKGTGRKPKAPKTDAPAA